MHSRFIYLLPGLAIGFALGARAVHLSVDADRDAWIERTSRCIETLENANDAKKRCISTLENVCAKLAQVEGADVIQAMLMHAEPYRSPRRIPTAGRTLEAASSEILTITSNERVVDRDGT
jgi:hypothetical protein